MIFLTVRVLPSPNKKVVDDYKKFNWTKDMTHSM